jgi:hypothetical protein
MRHFHTDSHLRLTIAARQDPDGYVDTLLGLAREHIIARQLLVSASRSPMRGVIASRNGSAARRVNLH